jgi:abhydrolase domain-containing protein 12
MSLNIRKRTKTEKLITNSSQQLIDEKNVSKSQSKGSKKLSFRGLKTLLKWFLILLLLVLTLSPIIFRYSLTVRRMLVFMNYVNVPVFKNLSDPQNSFQMNCTRVLFLNTNESIRLGVWHILPQSRRNDCLLIDDLIAFDDNRPIVLYLHGNGGARGGEHRLKLYDVLSNNGLSAHVITFDYRGYGDSTNVWPTPHGITNDAIYVYYWLLRQKNVHKKRVIVWGHSLGSAITLRFISQLAKGDNPRAIVLEAPFTSIREAIKWHPFAFFYRHLPLFEWFFVEPIVENELTNFDSISLLNKIDSPLLILHAMDDTIIPFHLGHKLYEHSLELQPKYCRKAQMIAFNGEYGYGHKNIYKDPELPKIIDNYIKSTEH